MFAVVISEKGGAERREAFDHPEINIGRVQGNDLMLPKGNVSKRHARLVYRDGRFIVTDLNSTNGTYVNRRRISQATIVRQGDRIYIGDFVLRIEAQEDAASASAPRSGVPIPLREPMLTSPDGAPRSKPPAPPPPPVGYPQVPPAPRVPGPADPLSPVPSSLSREASVADRTPGSRDPSLSDRTPGPRDPSHADRTPAAREDSIDTDTTAYRSAVAAMVNRVVERLDPGALDGDVPAALAQRVDRTVNEQLEALRREEVIGASVAEERLKRDVRAEVLELGALGPLLADENVSQIAVLGPSAIAAIRAGKRAIVEPPFSSEASLRRVLGRLLRKAGAAASGETLVACRLPDGFELSAVTGARAPSGTLLRLERSQRVDTTFEDLVRAGTVSRGMATFLRQCMAVRANVLVVGPRDAHPAVVAGALVSACTDGHVVAVHDTDHIVSNSVSVAHIDVADAKSETGALVEFAGRFPEARLVVDNFSGPLAVAGLEAVAAGADGLVAVLHAGSLRRALLRLPADLAATRAGLGVEAAREWVAATFDVVIDVSRMKDGRRRVVRVAEPLAVVDGEITLRDVFTFVVERTATGGSLEGTFQATGIAPRVVGEMTARGISVDSGVFSRPPSR